MDGDSLYVAVCEHLSDEIIAEHDEFIFQWCHNFTSDLEHSMDFTVTEVVAEIVRALPE
jgi:hypothetical protein